MIVRDEAEHLPACLASAAGLADEVVVVDTGSKDDTRPIALAHGARVHDFPWEDNFAAARNESIRHARGRWILWLDADDRLTPESREKLGELLRSISTSTENTAYLMTVSSPGPDGGPMFETLHARLFQNDPRIRWEYRVHEQIVPAIHRSGGSLQDTDISIVHIGYAQPSAVTAKWTRNLRLLDRSLETSPLDGFLLSCRAATLVDLGRSTEALVALNLCALSFRGRSPPPNVFALTARAYAMEGELHAALLRVREGLSAYPADARLLFAEAETLCAPGSYEEAETCLRAQLLLGEQHARFACADRTIAGFRVRHLLAELLLHRGQWAGHASLLKAKVRVLFEEGVGGEAIHTAVRETLKADPLCMWSWAVQRACETERNKPLRTPARSTSVNPALARFGR
jgi:hypothetical protein